MTAGEIALGLLIAFGFIAAAVVYALRSSGSWGPSRHDVSGGGDYADSHVRHGPDDAGGGDAGGGDGGD